MRRAVASIPNSFVVEGLMSRTYSYAFVPQNPPTHAHNVQRPTFNVQIRPRGRSVREPGWWWRQRPPGRAAMALPARRHAPALPEDARAIRMIVQLFT